MDILQRLDELRRSEGYLTVSELADAEAHGNTIFDPFSVLISRSCRIGAGNTFYPSVIIRGGIDGDLSIGADNVFHGNTLIVAGPGSIAIGDGNQFGEGGISVKANRDGARIEIGNGGRYLGGASILGRCLLGSGSQVLGNISLDSCTLRAGDPHAGDDPDARAGVVKGTGVARGITVDVGEVAALDGPFRSEDLVRQTMFHPKS